MKDKYSWIEFEDCIISNMLFQIISTSDMRLIKATLKLSNKCHNETGCPDYRRADFIAHPFNFLR